MTLEALLAVRRGRARRPGRQTYAVRAARTAELLAKAKASNGQRRAELLNEVILVNRVVAVAVAARYRNRGIDQEDLEQVALEGLTKAVRRFDLHSGNDLLTYAVPTIRGELQRYFRDFGWAVRPPRRVQELQWRIGAATEMLTHEVGHEPTAIQVAELMGIELEEHDVAMAARGCFRPVSIDQPAGAEGHGVLGDLLVSLDPEMSAAEARAILEPVVRRLSRHDQRILYLRYFEELTQAQIGEKIGVTQTQVSRLLTGILGNLRAQLEGASSASPPGRR